MAQPDSKRCDNGIVFRGVKFARGDLSAETLQRFTECLHRKGELFVRVVYQQQPEEGTEDSGRVFELAEFAAWTAILGVAGCDGTESTAEVLQRFNKRIADRKGVVMLRGAVAQIFSGEDEWKLSDFVWFLRNHPDATNRDGFVFREVVETAMTKVLTLIGMPYTVDPTTCKNIQSRAAPFEDQGIEFLVVSGRYAGVFVISGHCATALATALVGPQASKACMLAAVASLEPNEAGVYPIGAPLANDINNRLEFFVYSLQARALEPVTFTIRD